ncbi:MAG: HAD family hydrolase [Nannocystaceae bacterium]
MRPLAELSPRDVCEISLLATDVDGTLTRGGKLQPDVVDAIGKLHDHGITLLPISGRPAGEVLGLCRYLPGVTRGVAENGLLEIVPDRAPRWLREPTNRARLKEVGAQLNRDHAAKLQVTGDDFCRIGDVAYERDGRGEEELLRLAGLVAGTGVHLVWSNVHIHLAEALPDKGAALFTLASELEIAPTSIATIGDSLNDTGLFRRADFGLTVGTADVARHADLFARLPARLTDRAEADGFLQLVSLLLAARGTNTQA